MFKRYHNNSATSQPKVAWRHGLESTGKKQEKPNSNEQKYYIRFVKNQNASAGQASCWLPEPDFINKMEPSAVVAQKDHKYFIMAYLCVRTHEYARTKKLRDKMEELKKLDQDE